MPELPDLLYIERYLQDTVVGRTITDSAVRQPVVVRVLVPEGFEIALLRQTILNLMLAGRLQHLKPGEKPAGHLCVSLRLDDSSRLNLCDEQKMAKVYLVPAGEYSAIPKYNDQGVDIRSPGFTLSVFRSLAAKHSRRQVRVFINDHTALSAIGNAYADEFLFDARIHPKTFVSRLSDDDFARLYVSIRSVLDWGIQQVAAARLPIHVKVRDHMKVRNRKNEPCPRCGTTIRREGVRGYDVFFCPECQPATREHFLNWK